MALMVPWRTFNIHETFPFFIVENGSLKGSLGNPKWFFYCFATKTISWNLYCYYVDRMYQESTFGDLPCGHQKENHSEKGDSVPAVCVSVAVDMTLTSAAWRWALQDILMHGQNWEQPIRAQKGKSQPMKGLQDPKKLILPASILN